MPALFCLPIPVRPGRLVLVEVQRGCGPVPVSLPRLSRRFTRSARSSLRWMRTRSGRTAPASVLLRTLSSRVMRWWRSGRTSDASTLIVRQRGGGSGLVQQIDVTVLLGAGETAVDGSRLVALYRIRHVASADHASALTAVQVGRVTQTALTTLWPSVEAEEVPARHDQLHGAHAPRLFKPS
jgi:hypothetical protein